jgi:hypothetical protein
LLLHLTKKMSAVSDTELAAVLGLPDHQLGHWRKESTTLSPSQVVNVIANAHKTAKSHAHSSAVKALVEFYPIRERQKALSMAPTGRPTETH